MVRKHIILLVNLCSIIILVIISYYSWKKIKRENDIKKEIIISSIGDPQLISESISPLNITLTNDMPNNNGGLTYLKTHTHKLNLKLIHDLYRHDLKIILPNDTHIIFGAGTTMMVSALYYSLQKKLNKPINIKTNTDVFYLLHKNLTFSAKNVEWTNTNSYADLAILVSPSNPLGVLADPNEIKEKYKLFDTVYDKSLFSGKHKSINEKIYENFKTDNKIFITSSFSKLGIPAIRFGYLLTRDPEIAKYCKEYVKNNSIRYPSTAATISRIAYYKFFCKRDWQNNIYKIISKRRKFFYKHAKKHKIEILSKNNLVPYIYTNKSVNWWLKKFKVCTRKGSDFNDSDENSRFNLMITTEYWNEFKKRFSQKN